MIALAARGFTVRIGAFRLGPVELVLPSGEIHALLGPNGSGKTTFLRAAQGLLPADSGTLEMFGAPVLGRPVRMLDRLGYVPDDPEDVIAEMTAPELWELAALARTRDATARRSMLDRAAELAAFLDFQPPRGTIAGFSHGMRKKAQLVSALMHDPALLILDEPRNGLDPLGIMRLESLMASAAASGAAILVSSHDLHWAARVASCVHVLQNGRILASGPPGELLGDHPDDVVAAFLRMTGAKIAPDPQP